MTESSKRKKKKSRSLVVSKLFSFLFAALSTILFFLQRRTLFPRAGQSIARANVSHSRLGHWESA